MLDESFLKFAARALHFYNYGLYLYSKLFKTGPLKKFILIAFVLVAFSFSSQAQQSKLSSPGAQTTLVRFYPNPATTVINFDFQKAYEGGHSIQIFNAILGRKVFEQANLSERTAVNLNDFSRGMYIYQLFDKSGRMVESGKFQVAK